ncbi:MAG: hypothetical protein AAF403_06320, partial [Pseudomonadota bacterium]
TDLNITVGDREYDTAKLDAMLKSVIEKANELGYGFHGVTLRNVHDINALFEHIEHKQLNKKI